VCLWDPRYLQTSELLLSLSTTLAAEFTLQSPSGYLQAWDGPVLFNRNGTHSRLTTGCPRNPSAAPEEAEHPRWTLVPTALRCDGRIHFV
jgi:hypothetical protein